MPVVLFGWLKKGVVLGLVVGWLGGRVAGWLGGCWQKDGAFTCMVKKSYKKLHLHTIQVAGMCAFFQIFKIILRGFIGQENGERFKR